MKISLCMIVGNVEEYILRCLASFAPIADEICVVRAIGSQTPDRTMELAQGFCLARDIRLKVAHYPNKAFHLDWPHVDDFAAARNMAFEMAEGDYCFWCDSDDVLDDKSEDRNPKTEGNPKSEIRVPNTVELIRGHAEKGEYLAYVFPYNIFGRGVSVPRERMIKRGSGKWRYPVHECFVFAENPVHGMEDQRVVVTHLPHLNKSGSSERNLRILKSIPEKDLSAGLLYHLQGELALSGDITGSIKVAERALRAPDLGRPERYELWLNLAQLSTHPRAKESMLQAAYAADPRRREALGLLACHSMDYGASDLALAYGRQMVATLPPASPDWNDRAAVYGWLGEEIYSQVLRVNGYEAEAEALRRMMLQKAGGARIALVHATRGRPQQAAMCRKVWLDLAERPAAIEHLFVMDADDQESVALKRMHHMVVPAGGGCVRAWNEGARATEAPVIVQLSDDWVPVPRWDSLILERLGDVKQQKVLAVSDGVRGDRLLCMAICTRDYLIRDGYLFHPDFTGVFSDNWFTDCAYRRGAVIEARDIQFVHEHPVRTGKPLDRTYADQNAPERYEAGERVYRKLCERQLQSET